MENLLKNLTERFLLNEWVWDEMEAMPGQMRKFPIRLQDQVLSPFGKGTTANSGLMSICWKVISYVFFVTLLNCGLFGCGQNSSGNFRSADEAEVDTIAKLSSLSALNLEGKQVLPFSSLANGINKGAVILFVATDCPISNRYAPEVKRIYERFKDEAIPFYLVYTRPDESFEDIQKHLHDFDYPMTALVDKERQLTEHTGAQVTPEAVVFDAKGKMIYRGRIDDRFEDFGLSRQESTTHELEDVMALIAEGKTQDFHEEIAVGCYIVELFEETGDE